MKNKNSIPVYALKAAHSNGTDCCFGLCWAETAVNGMRMIRSKKLSRKVYLSGQPCFM